MRITVILGARITVMAKCCEILTQVPDCLSGSGSALAKAIFT